MSKTRRSAGLLLSLACLAPFAFGAEYKIDGRTFTLPDGFVIEKVASTPLVDRPITAAFDEQGRLYVADSSGTNDKVQKQLEDKPHRIVRLEDTDNDGRYDKSIVFADRMMFPEGTMWLDGSLYVAAPPSIWKLTDTDGDGVADQRTEWFEGKTLTGCANDLHGPYAGPDGWVYWAKGAFAEQTYDRPGKSPFVTRAAHIFRARPGREKAYDIEPVMTGGMDNPVDVVFTPSGERLFTTTFLQHPAGGKRDGIIHAVYGGVWGKVHNVIDNHVRTSPDVMPVLVHLGPAAPCGFHRYESDAFGKEYKDNLFATLFNLHKVTRHVLTPAGATFTTKDEDFLVCDSLDFHPTDVIEDADGSLLVLDTGGWYKLCCPTSQLVKPDLLGAIYRIRRTDTEKIHDPRGLQVLWQHTDLALLAGDSRPFVRNRAIRELAKREDAAFRFLGNGFDIRSPDARLGLLQAVARIGSPDAAASLRHSINNEEDFIRHFVIHAVGLRRDRGALPELLKALEDDSAQIRRAATEAIGRLGDASAVAHLFKALEKSDPADRVLEHSLIYAIIEIGDAHEPAKFVAHADPRVQRAAMIALDQVQGGKRTPDAVAKALTSPDPALRDTAAWIAARHPEWADALAETFRAQMAAENESDRERLRQQLARLSKAGSIQKLLAETSRNESARPAERKLALEAIRLSSPRDVPAEWVESLTLALQSKDAVVIAAAVSATRNLQFRKEATEKIATALLKVAERDDLPAPTRVEAAAALPKGSASISPALFAFLSTQLSSADQPLPQRLAAADGLARAKLASDQLRALADAIKTAGPLELDRVLASVEQSTDAAVGMALLAAIRDAKYLKALPPEAIRRRFAKYPSNVVSAGEELIATLSPDFANQKAKLDDLLATLPSGDVRRGQAIFNSDKSACATCHAIGYLGGNVGPDLTKIGSIRQERDLLESIIFPSASFVQTYEPLMVDTKDNDRQYGIPRRNDSEEVLLITGPNTEVRIPRSNVKMMKPGVLSVMPEGFDQNFTKQELADLLAFLKACR